MTDIPEIDRRLLIRLTDLELDTRTYTCFFNAGLSRVGDLMFYEARWKHQTVPGNLLRMKKFGHACLDVLKDELATLGLGLRRPENISREEWLAWARKDANPDDTFFLPAVGSDEIAAIKEERNAPKPVAVPRNPADLFTPNAYAMLAAQPKQKPKPLSRRTRELRKQITAGVIDATKKTTLDQLARAWRTLPRDTYKTLAVTKDGKFCGLIVPYSMRHRLAIADWVACTYPKPGLVIGNETGAVKGRWRRNEIRSLIFTSNPASIDRLKKLKL